MQNFWQILEEQIPKKIKNLLLYIKFKIFEKKYGL
jgi:hypothetical protein